MAEMVSKWRKKMNMNRSVLMLATDELKALNTDIEDLPGVELEIRQIQQNISVSSQKVLPVDGI